MKVRTILVCPVCGWWEGDYEGYAGLTMKCNGKDLEKPPHKLTKMERVEVIENTAYGERILELQHMLDAAGGVPADVPLTARLDYVLKVRAGDLVE